MDFEPIKIRKIYEEITEQFRKLVVEGKLKPGDRLPSEQELVERLQVSKPSIREALSALEMLGLLEVRHGEGAYLSNCNTVVTPLSWMLALDEDAIKQLMEARKILEAQTAGLAAERATQTELQNLAKTIEEMSTAREAGKFEIIDVQFHSVIIQASHNKILIRMMNSISDTIRQTIKYGFAKERYIETLYQEHVGIYEAIKAKRPVTACERMRAHLENTEEAILNTFYNEHSGNSLVCAH